MHGFFVRLEQPAYALLRLVCGFTFACHGAQKILGAFGGHVEPTFSLLWFAGIIELVGGALIAVGLLTRFAAFIASGEMAYAFFAVHMQWNIKDLHWIPILNKGELAAVYCVLFLYVCGRGAGAASLDRLFRLER